MAVDAGFVRQIFAGLEHGDGAGFFTHVADDRLQAEAFALAQSIAEGPTIAIRYMKDNLDEALMFDFATARDHEAERMVRTQMTADHKEAVQAFIEKRKPVFSGH